MKTLTTRQIRALEPGLKARRDRVDKTLYILTQPSGAQSFVQRLTINGRSTDLGLGPYPLVTLQAAKDAALENRRKLREGLDPREAKRAAKVPSVAEAIEKVIELNRAAWKPGSKSEKSWRQSFKYAKRIMRRRVDQVDSGDILALLEPIWNDKRETANRLLQRISTVMDWSITEGFRSDNPATPVKANLPKTGRKVKHHKALPFAEVGAALETVEATGAWWATKACLRFLTLAALRSKPARALRWEHIQGDVAIIPPENMKKDLEHRLPLTAQMLEILDHARAHSDGSGLVFPSARGKEQSDSTMSKLLRENGIEAVPHGMRSSFDDYCGEMCPTIPREVVRLALSHVDDNKTRAAYRRTDYFDMRRELMARWNDYVTSKTTGKVVRLRR